MEQVRTRREKEAEQEMRNKRLIALIIMGCIMQAFGIYTVLTTQPFTGDRIGGAIMLGVGMFTVVMGVLLEMIDL